jgi:hypothetical protein
MTESRTTSLYLTYKALERLDAVRGHYYSRSKALSLLLENLDVDAFNVTITPPKNLEKGKVS